MTESILSKKLNGIPPGWCIHTQLGAMSCRNYRAAVSAVQMWSRHALRGAKCDSVAYAMPRKADIRLRRNIDRSGPESDISPVHSIGGDFDYVWYGTFSSMDSNPD